MYQVYKDDIIYIDMPQLSVGVLSDSQLSPFGMRADVYDANLVSALSTVKQYNCGVVILAGDIVNLGYSTAWRRYVRALDKVYGNNKPVIMTVMGNHDYYRLGSRMRSRQLYCRYTGNALCQHYCINGYHFITLSQSYGSLNSGHSQHKQWLTEHLDKAVADGGDRPIVVVTHMCAQHSVYGSDIWGDDKLTGMLDKYPTVVNVGGHSHFSLLDERSIHQQQYTSINTQSLSYVELEKGKSNGTVPPLAYVHPMGMIMQYGQHNIDVLRVSMLDGIEQKADRRWQLPTIIDSSSFVYTDNRQYGKPSLVGSGSASMCHGKTTLQLTAGTDDDFVNSYQVQLYGLDGRQYTRLYFSDYYLGIDSMATTVTLPLYNVPRGVYNVRVRAVNSGGNISDNYIDICKVTVARKLRYKGITSPYHKFSGI